VVDGYLWSTRENIAGLRLKTVMDGTETLVQGGDPNIAQLKPGTLRITWPITSFQGTFVIDIDEHGELSTPNKNITFRIKPADNTVRMTFELTD